MFHTLLATIILTIFLFFPQVLNANDSQQLFLFTYGVTNNGFLIAIYINPDSNFVIVAESPEIACVLTDGMKLYVTKGRDL